MYSISGIFGIKIWYNEDRGSNLRKDLAITWWLNKYLWFLTVWEHEAAVGTFIAILNWTLWPLLREYAQFSFIHLAKREAGKASEFKKKKKGNEWEWCGIWKNNLNMRGEESLFILLKSCLRSDRIAAWGRIVLGTVVQGRVVYKQAGKKVLLSRTPAAPSVTVFNLQADLDLVGKFQH